MTLLNFFESKAVNPIITSVVTDVVAIFPEIMNVLRQGGAGYSGAMNATGDKQVVADIKANELLVNAMRNNKSVALIASEELSEPVMNNNAGQRLRKSGDGESYSVAFDPLDGSSLVDVNMSVGTIVGIYKGGDLLARSGRELVCSILAVYGPALTFLIAFSDEVLGGDKDGGGSENRRGRVGRGSMGGVYEFIYNFARREFVLSGEKLMLAEKGRIFSPGNLNVAIEEKWFHEMLHYWLEKGYKLRYSGGMAPDVNHILKKGGGVYVYPGSVSAPDGKLRLLYECAPVAFLVEQAGGRAVSFVDKKVVNILDIPIKQYHQIVPFVCGSTREVELIISKTQ